MSACRARTGSRWRAGCASGALGSASSWSPPPAIRSIVSSGSKAVRTTTSPSRLSRANSWRGSRAYCGGTPTEGPRVRIGRRVLDLDRRVLINPADGNEERLAASEFDLLKIFAENPSRPLMRDWLLEVTAHREAEAFDRAIDLRITRLRRKVEIDPAHPEALRTVRGVGYMFVPPKD